MRCGATGRLDLGKVVLEPDAAIEGVVVDRQGNPVADAVIAFALAKHGTSIPDPPRLGAGWDSVTSGPDGRFRSVGGVTESQPAGTAQTAADGSFSFSTLKPGGYVVAVIDPPALLALHLPVELDADRDLPIEVATGSVKGRVVLAASGDPVAGATVTVDSASLGLLSSLFMPPPVATAEDGSFQFDSLPEGLYRIKAVKPGLAPGEASVQVPAQDAVRTELALAPGHDSP